MLKIKCFHFLIECVSYLKLEINFIRQNILNHTIFSKLVKDYSIFSFKEFLINLIFYKIKYENILRMIFQKIKTEFIEIFFTQRASTNVINLKRSSIL